VDGVLFGALSGLEVAVLAALWSFKPGIGEGRKWLLIRCGATPIICGLIFGITGWWRTKLTGLDKFMALIYPLSFAVTFVCSWLAAAPAALSISVGENDK